MKTIEIKGKRVPVPWRACDAHGAIVSDSGQEFRDTSFIGGHVICVGVNHAYMPLILAAPQLFVALKDFLADIKSGNLDPESMTIAAELIDELEAPP